MNQVNTSRYLGRKTISAAAPLVCALVASLGLASANAVTTVAAPAAVQDLGVANPSSTVSATIWVKGSAEASLDAVIADLYDSNSSTYHEWMTAKQLASYEPSAQDVASLKASLAASGLTAVHTSQDGTIIKVSGSAAAMQAAFGTTIHQLQVNGKTFFKATSVPKFKGAHAELVGAVTGLSGGHVRSFAVKQTDPATGSTVAAVTPQAGTDPLAAFTTNCFVQDAKINPTAIRGGTTSITRVSAQYEGAAFLSVTTTAHPACGFTAKQVVDHYGINEAHALGWTGKGQTIVIVDAYGSPTIAADTNTFSQIMHLPAMTPDTLQVVNSAGAPATTDSGWATETTLDVEWAHAIAPDAKIVFVVAPTDETGDLADSVTYAIQNQLGNVISGSWGLPENEAALGDATMFNKVLRKAAAQGISVNMATGDSGDNGQG